ncbi:hypothetical protein HY629_02680 [Candidatus Uhrbacteria bacterium]|nr:hypothetical protein [Candidatus Uhrbacteria bacterium]
MSRMIAVALPSTAVAGTGDVIACSDLRLHAPRVVATQRRRHRLEV